ncbi:MAG TPA: Do family serine endopeptidase [Burkholderiales bacterium]|jgi:Do/DeqQ family serine protease|nr:Do family serine endopeptidase [Burkholderiales bacterium]
MIRALFLALAMTGAQAQLPVREGLPTLAPILEKVTPAVVNIKVLQRSPEEQNPMLRDPFFRRFFGLPQQAEPQIAAGSGVIVDAKNGYVITNAHVVKDAREIKVTLRDNRELAAKLVGSDPGTDIAVIKVEPARLVDIKFGDSDALQVGDFVIAIGNPFGLGQTATSGIVSALGRSGLNVEGYEHFIQTDASINPGNSGGALVNLKGELIGINTAILGPANVGIGFAVPSVLASAVMDQLIRFGEVKRGRLGIGMAASVGGTEGALIAEVEPNSPAATAGLKKGDVVTALNGHPVRGPAELRARLAVVPVGDTVELKVQRGKENPVLKAQIGEIERQAATTAGQPSAELNGASLAEVQRSGLPGKDRAILVTKVETGSPAFGHGIRANDLIIGVNQRRITTTQELAKALRAQGRLALNVVRGEFLLTIQLR